MFVPFIFGYSFYFEVSAYRNYIFFYFISVYDWPPKCTFRREVIKIFSLFQVTVLLKNRILRQFYKHVIVCLSKMQNVLLKNIILTEAWNCTEVVDNIKICEIECCIFSKSTYITQFQLSWLKILNLPVWRPPMKHGRIQVKCKKFKANICIFLKTALQLN